MKPTTCCFSGHRRLPKDKIEHIVKRLNWEVDNLISQGVTDFISGGALGFDQIAAALIVTKKEMGHPIRLIFALPCRNQDALWREDQKELYHGLLGEADEIVYISDKYTDSCMKERNRYMVDRSGYCICALLHQRSGTAQTVRYARELGGTVINLMGEVNMNSANETRAVMSRIGALAEKARCAIVLIGHMNKGSGNKSCLEGSAGSAAL